MNNTPIRHGDWHLIDGHLVDMSQSAAEIPDSPKAVTGSDVDGDLPPISLPLSSPKRRKSPSED